MNRMITYFLVALSLAVAGCSNHSSEDPVLAQFKICTALSATDSIRLDQSGILMPEGIFRFKDWFLVRKQGSNAVDLLDAGSHEVIHCFRKGRGPEEVLKPSSFQLSDGHFFLYDTHLQHLYSLDLEETIEQHEQVISPTTDYQFENLGRTDFARPFLLYSYSGGMIASGLFEKDIWYGQISPDGQIVHPVKRVSFENTTGFSAIEQSTLHIPSFMTVKPDGKAMVCALGTAAALSFSSLKDNALTESKRIVYYAPILEPTRDSQLPVMKYSSKNRRAFCGIQSDNKYIYLLYSGKTNDEETPAYQCNHLLVMDWEARPVHHYLLDKSINSFYIENGILYGASSHPESRIYEYRLPE